ncbi:hypothetical protein ACEN8I_05255 [Polaromonas sp. CT11-55]|uniref:hypothetical protein n=1 Tax=Polaromonas sp. CT11-55 TaxID=3243045 RepID=UPI0039A62F47
MNALIKPTTLPFAGYVYQTLVGFKLLTDWLDDPGRYNWVVFEAHGEGAKGLDDLIAARSDGLHELIQVKFTVDAFRPEHALSWEWLLSRKGVRGTSLLQKWSAAVADIGPALVHSAALLTNRRPDDEFSAHLADARVDYARLDVDLQKRIEADLGGPQEARDFFNLFRFDHSFTGLESLEGRVIDHLVPRHTDRDGWLNLFRNGLDWAIRKNSPAPAGRITMAILRGTISARRPRVLNQEFKIPEDYRPPDAEFAERFFADVTQQAQVRVLWGSPGQGKSTFLSFVCQRMLDAKLPFVRHHYFLDLADTRERLTANAAANSLIWQMRTEHPEVTLPPNQESTDLRACIAACAEHYGAKGRPFTVVIDGLDHVWRENDEDISPLEGLFRQLLPLPNNVSLVIGTQKVDASRLPGRLTDYVNASRWVELPLMDLEAVHHWLGVQYKEASFDVPASARRDTLPDLAKAFASVSGGHPLVLTYIFERLASDYRELTVSRVQDADPAPSPNVEVYYQGMWRRLSSAAKDALHLLASSSFIWPEHGLESCLNLEGSLVMPELGHLLVETDAGLRAFHGSLHVFVCSRDDHVGRAELLRPRVAAWLKEDAPAHLRWAWLWIYQQRSGQPAELLEGTTRDWVVTSLAKGYSNEQVTRILEAAEDAAFGQADYGLLQRKRALKSRLENGMTFQVDDSSILWRCAKLTCEDPNVVALLASELNAASFEELHLLALSYLGFGNVESAIKVREQMRRRFNAKVAAHAFEQGEHDSDGALFLEITAKTDSFDPPNIVRFLRHKEDASVFRTFLAHLATSSTLDRLLSFGDVAMPLRMRKQFEVEAVRMAGLNLAAVHVWPAFSRFGTHPLSVCWAQLYVPDAVPPRRPLRRHPVLDMDGDRFQESDTEFATYLHEAFFHCVSASLTLNGAPDSDAMPVPKARPWLSAALKRLELVAQTAGKVLARGDTTAFALPYRLLELAHPGNNEYDAMSDYRAFRRAATLIAADLFLLTRLRTKLDYIPGGEWIAARTSSVFFAEDLWRELFFNLGYRLLNPSLVAEEIHSQAKSIAGEVIRFSDAANELTSLAEWATAYGLQTEARQLLESCYRWVIGYGWRKDSYLHHVIRMVEELLPSDPDTASRLVLRLAPIMDRIGDMTEDSGVYESDLSALVLILLPQHFAAYYRHWLAQEEWYVAERCFGVFAKHASGQDPFTPAMAAFLWDGIGFAELERRPETRVLTGRWNERSSKGAKQATPEKEVRPAPTDGPAAPAPDPLQFPPVKLEEYLAALEVMRKYELERKLLGDWFNHWRHAGAAVDLLKAVKRVHTEKGFRSRGSELLDLCFPLSLEAEGPSRAFEWLVLAHIERSGWEQHFYGSEESDRRLTAVVNHYPKRWEEFLRRTTVPEANRYGAGRVAPGTVLVSFLLELGEVARASNLAETIVDISCQEFDMQPLQRPAWLPVEK